MKILILSCDTGKGTSHAVGTDYTCIPFWEETNLDYYIIPHEDLIPES